MLMIVDATKTQLLIELVEKDNKTALLLFTFDPPGGAISQALFYDNRILFMKDIHAKKDVKLFLTNVREILSIESYMHKKFQNAIIIFDTGAVEITLYDKHGYISYNNGKDNIMYDLNTTQPDVIYNTLIRALENI